jgi:hypothetical protein
MYRKVAVSDRLPENGKEVITIDSDGKAISYKRFGDSWNMVNTPNNKPLEYWLEEVEDGSLSEAFKVFIDKCDSEDMSTILMSTPDTGVGAKMHFQGNIGILTQMVTQMMRYNEDIADTFIEAVNAYNEQKNK